MNWVSDCSPAAGCIAISRTRCANTSTRRSMRSCRAAGLETKPSRLLDANSGTSPRSRSVAVKSGSGRRSRASSSTSATPFASCGVTPRSRSSPSSFSGSVSAPTRLSSASSTPSCSRRCRSAIPIASSGSCARTPGDGSSRSWSVDDYEALQDLPALDELTTYEAAFARSSYKLTGDAEPDRVAGVMVPANFFPFLGVSPLLGRTFTEEECRLNGPGAVILSHGLWQRRYSARPDVIGRQVIVNDRPAHDRGSHAALVRLRGRLRAGHADRRLHAGRLRRSSRLGQYDGRHRQAPSRPDGRCDAVGDQRHPRATGIRACRRGG